MLAQQLAQPLATRALRLTQITLGSRIGFEHNFQSRIRALNRVLTGGSTDTKMQPDPFYSCKLRHNLTPQIQLISSILAFRLFLWRYLRLKMRRAEQKAFPAMFRPYSLRRPVAGPLVWRLPASTGPCTAAHRRLTSCAQYQFFFCSPPPSIIAVLSLLCSRGACRAFLLVCRRCSRGPPIIQVARWFRRFVTARR